MEVAGLVLEAIRREAFGPRAVGERLEDSIKELSTVSTIFRSQDVDKAEASRLARVHEVAAVVLKLENESGNPELLAEVGWLVFSLVNIGFLSAADEIERGRLLECLPVMVRLVKNHHRKVRHVGLRCLELVLEVLDYECLQPLDICGVLLESLGSALDADNESDLDPVLGSIYKKSLECIHTVMTISAEFREDFVSRQLELWLEPLLLLGVVVQCRTCEVIGDIAKSPKFRESTGSLMVSRHLLMLSCSSDLEVAEAALLAMTHLVLGGAPRKEIVKAGGVQVLAGLVASQSQAVRRNATVVLRTLSQEGEKFLSKVRSDKVFVICLSQTIKKGSASLPDVGAAAGRTSIVSEFGDESGDLLEHTLALITNLANDKRLARSMVDVGMLKYTRMFEESPKATEKYYAAIATKLLQSDGRAANVDVTDILKQVEDIGIPSKSAVYSQISNISSVSRANSEGLASGAEDNENPEWASAEPSLEDIPEEDMEDAAIKAAQSRSQVAGSFYRKKAEDQANARKFRTMFVVLRLQAWWRGWKARRVYLSKEAMEAIREEVRQVKKIDNSINADHMYAFLRDQRIATLKAEVAANVDRKAVRTKRNNSILSKNYIPNEAELSAAIVLQVWYKRIKIHRDEIRRKRLEKEREEKKLVWASELYDQEQDKAFFSESYKALPSFQSFLQMQEYVPSDDELDEMTHTVLPTASVFSSYLAKRFLLARANNRRQIENDSATRIQKAFRGSAAMRAFRIRQAAEQEKKVIVMQKIWRGRLASKELDRRVEERNRGLAAISLQCWFRIKKAKEEMGRRKEEHKVVQSSKRIQRWFRSRLSSIDVKKQTMNSVWPGLLESVRNSDTSTAATLLYYGAPVNFFDEKKNTLAMLASQRGNGVLVETLISMGADTNRQNIDGETALHFAAQHRHVDICRKLIEAGANPNLLNRYGDKFSDRVESYGYQRVLQAIAGLEKKSALSAPGQSRMNSAHDLDTSAQLYMRKGRRPSSAGRAMMGGTALDAPFLKVVAAKVSENSHKRTHSMPDFHESSKDLLESIKDDVEALSGPKGDGGQDKNQENVDADGGEGDDDDQGGVVPGQKRSKKRRRRSRKSRPSAISSCSEFSLSKSPLQNNQTDEKVKAFLSESRSNTSRMMRLRHTKLMKALSFSKSVREGEPREKARENRKGVAPHNHKKLVRMSANPLERINMLRPKTEEPMEPEPLEYITEEDEPPPPGDERQGDAPEIQHENTKISRMKTDLRVLQETLRAQPDGAAGWNAAGEEDHNSIWGEEDHGEGTALEALENDSPQQFDDDLEGSAGDEHEAGEADDVGQASPRQQRVLPPGVIPVKSFGSLPPLPSPSSMLLGSPDRREYTEIVARGSASEVLRSVRMFAEAGDEAPEW